MQPPPDVNYIASRLAEAGGVLMAVRDLEAAIHDAESLNFWLQLIAAALDAHSLWHQRTRWPEPSEAEVRRMQEALSWLRFLAGPPAALVALRCLRVPGSRQPLLTWNALGPRFKLSPVNVRAMHMAATQTIAERLTREAKRAADPALRKAKRAAQDTGELAQS